MAETAIQLLLGEMMPLYALFKSYLIMPHDFKYWWNTTFNAI